jgi:ATP-binding cassette subfamily B multidrug efflux pump
MPRPMHHEKPKDLRKTIRFLGQYLKKERFGLLLTTALVVISSGVNVFGTYLLKPAINDYILPGDIPGLIRMLVFMGVLYVVGVLSSYGYSQLMVKVAQKIILDIRNDLFRKIQTLPLSFSDAKTHGELMSRFTNDIDTIADALNNSFTAVIQSFILIVGTCSMLILLSPLLSCIVFASFFCMFLFLRYSSKKSHTFFSMQQKYMGNLNGFIEEMVEGQKVVEIFNHEEANLREFSKRNRQLRDAATDALTYSGILIPVVVSISYFNYALTACLGAYFTIIGWMDLGGLASYLVYVRQTSAPVNQFASQLNFIMAALSGTERIAEIMEVSSETDSGSVTLVHTTGEEGGMLQEAEHGPLAWRIPQEDKPPKLVPLRGDVRFHDVIFGYVPEQPILKKISLYAKPGQKIAFVGSTGAGKTTIASLINRLYDIDSGSITFDGIDIRNIKKDDLRRSIAVVLQDTHLFTGTIADNIRFGNAEADFEQVVQAAKLANADSFIRRLPNGYDTVLTEDASNLSQGQRQLLAIARAAVADPPVLILDEATSSVDTHTEKLIETAMDRLMENRTVFVIAHRLSTVRNAKAIIVLENGEILERGTHDELVAKRGRYYQLYTGQLELA